MSQAAGQPDEWVFLFYVPYANDLWHAASRVFGSISSAFAKAARDAKRCRNARVLMQYKLRGDAPMRRRHWHCNAAVEWGDDDHVIHSHEAASGDADSGCFGGGGGGGAHELVHAVLDEPVRQQHVREVRAVVRRDRKRRQRQRKVVGDEQRLGAGHRRGRGHPSLE